MKTTYYKEYSQLLNRDIEFKVYGEGGKPCIAFPTQNGTFTDYESNHMIEVIQPYIEQGKIQLYCVDGVELNESWSATGKDNRLRIELQEKYYRFITEEFEPYVHYKRPDWTGKLMSVGCGMGATQAANVFFRRPDLFDAVIALSGVYEIKNYYHNYMDDLVYANDIESYLQGMPTDHPFIPMYKNSRMIFCVGRGKWEEAMVHSMDRLHNILVSKGVENAWFDYWGYDVDQDWSWWRKQLVYFIESMDKDHLLG